MESCFASLRNWGFWCNYTICVNICFTYAVKGPLWKATERENWISVASVKFLSLIPSISSFHEGHLQWIFSAQAMMDLKEKQGCTGYSSYYSLPVFVPLHVCALTVFPFLSLRRGGKFSLSTCTQPHNTAIPSPSIHVSSCPTKYTLCGVAV